MLPVNLCDQRIASAWHLFSSKTPGGNILWKKISLNLVIYGLSAVEFLTSDILL